MADNLGYMPETVTAGETIWISASNTTGATNSDIVLSSYTPAGGYTLAYLFASASPITVSCVASGGNTGWTLEVTAAQTLAWKPGQISFSGQVTHTDTGRVWVVDQGLVRVLPSPVQASQYAAALASVDTAIEQYAANPYGSFTIPGGLSVSYRSIDDLLNLRGHYKQLIADTGATRQRRIIRTEFVLI